MSKLAAIAELLHREAAIKGTARHQLERGLTLTLKREGTDYILSLTRQDVQPSQAEEHICRQAFDIPENAARSAAVYQIVRLRWPAAEQKSFVGPVEENKPNHYQEGI